MSPRPPKVVDKFPREVSADTRRISGVTPGLTKAFAESPWRYLNRARGLQGLAGFGKKRGTGRPV